MRGIPHRGETQRTARPSGDLQPICRLVEGHVLLRPDCCGRQTLSAVINALRQRAAAQRTVTMGRKHKLDAGSRPSTAVDPRYTTAAHFTDATCCFVSAALAYASADAPAAAQEIAATNKQSIASKAAACSSRKGTLFCRTALASAVAERHRPSAGSESLSVLRHRE